MRTLGLLLSLALLACRGEATAQSVADTRLQHHELRADQLPRPYATRSAARVSDVVNRPPTAALHLPPGFKATVYASGLDEPRNMVVAPNGDVFVAESGGGRITILRGGRRIVFASGLYRPFGLAFHDGFLYVAEENRIARWPYTPGQTSARGEPQRVASVPGGGHWTRNIVFSRDGKKLYVAVGSSGNVEPERDPLRAAITEMNPDGSGAHVFAGGLRNPVGLAWEPVTGALWTVVNERDGLGDELVPDYATEVRRGAFYGWPYAYLGAHEDPRRAGERPDLVKSATVPSVLIESHSAPLGICFYTGTMFPPQYRGAAFVALHGSWNRSLLTGYKIISIPFKNGHPTGGYDDFMTGWLLDARRGTVWGRPVGVTMLPDGSLLVSDDGENVIWRVTYGH
jgi:glucose/arabinose dehydrogenase